jgi:hypothetical protein
VRSEWLAYGLRLDPGSLAGAYRLEDLSLAGIKFADPAPGVMPLSQSRPDRGDLYIVYPFSRLADITPQLTLTADPKQLSLIPHGGGFLMTTLNSAPRWEWPAIRTERYPAPLVRLYVEAPGRSSLRLYFRGSASQEYQDLDSLNQALVEGTNVLTFAVPASAPDAGLCLAPGQQPKPYRLAGAELFAALRSPGNEIYSRHDFAAVSSGALAALFTYSCGEPIFSLDLSRPENVEANSAMRVRPLSPALYIQARDADPFLIVPGMKVDPGAGYLLRLILEAPEATSCQLFYRAAGQMAFQELNSSRRPLSPGLNRVFFYLSAENLAQPVRLDPGETPGTYTLYGWQVRRLFAP